MRRALDCASADPRTPRERREALMAVVSLLMVREGQVGAAAAVLAGWPPWMARLGAGTSGCAGGR